METLPGLTAAQAAARLGVKRATLYAYVSRGLLSSVRSESGGSVFDALEVESLADTRSRGRSSGPADRSTMAGRPLMVVDSDLTLIENDDLYFRGRRATDLARSHSLEEAAELLWGGDGAHTSHDYGTDDELRRRLLQAGDVLGSRSRLIDRMTLSVTIVGSQDPLRDDLAPDIVLSTGRRILAAMIDCLPSLGTEPPPHSPLAARLWSKLSAEAPAPADLRILNAALVLSLDHDLATSTFAARVAASARANPYSSIGAALGAFDSVLHGGASILAVDLLSDVLLNHSPEVALRRQMSSTTGIPGFGHVLYSKRDPRAQCLFALMDAEPTYRVGVDAARRVIGVVRSRTTRIANVDLALAALAVSRDLRPDSGQAIFAVGRTVGWIAHIVAEYAETPLRLRPESRYTGRAAPQADH
ncbi:citrate/2-methylcitrate synthase [Agreia bicolorata]|uniref:citrate synthase (unknown stereospecificity) n=1 Tax=Agreia bicolorata TaxID=110935 RepID=A0ABR5CDU2_9MICO|nr:citrate/2-methylcitrate synthase [Agreia bicolorata]KJC63794.1 hypothetical protein TZ00_12180 [Agreia bicolorata]